VIAAWSSCHVVSCSWLSCHSQDQIPPISPVQFSRATSDIDRLLDLMIEEGLGVRETKALEVDRAFFKPYQKKIEHFEVASGLLPEHISANLNIR